MKTDEQLRDELALRKSKSVAGHLSKEVQNDIFLALQSMWIAARANPPRVEGDMERQRDAYAKAMAVALEDGVFPNKVATKKKIEELLRDTPQPDTDERKGPFEKFAEFVTEGDEPTSSPEALKRLDDTIKTQLERARTQSPTEPTREPLGSMEDQYLKIPAQAKQARRCACGKCHCLVCGNPMEAQSTREQVRELVEAVRRLRNEASGLLRAHEVALSMDGGNSNAACLRQRIAEVDTIIARFDKGGAG